MILLLFCTDEFHHFHWFLVRLELCVLKIYYR